MLHPNRESRLAWDLLLGVDVELSGRLPLSNMSADPVRRMAISVRPLNIELLLAANVPHQNAAAGTSSHQDRNLGRDARSFLGWEARDPSPFWLIRFPFLDHLSAEITSLGDSLPLIHWEVNS